MKSFGFATRGSTTINDTIKLYNGDALLISVARYALGTGDVIRGGVIPDVQAVGLSELAVNCHAS